MVYVRHRRLKVRAFFHHSRSSVAGISGLDKQNHPPEAFFSLDHYELSLSAECPVFKKMRRYQIQQKKYQGRSAVALSDATSAAGIPKLHPTRELSLPPAHSTAALRDGYERSRQRQGSLGEQMLINESQRFVRSWTRCKILHVPLRGLASAPAYSALEQGGSTQPVGMAGQHPPSPHLLLALMGIHRCYIRARKAPLLFLTWNCSKTRFRIISTKMKHKGYRILTKLVS